MDTPDNASRAEPYELDPRVVTKVACRRDEAAIARTPAKKTDGEPGESPDVRENTGEADGAPYALWDIERSFSNDPPRDEASRLYRAHQWGDALAEAQKDIRNGKKSTILVAAFASAHLHHYADALSLAESAASFNRNPDIFLVAATRPDAPSMVVDRAVDLYLDNMNSSCPKSLKTSRWCLELMMPICDGPGCAANMDARYFVLGRGLYRGGRYDDALRALSFVGQPGRGYGYAPLAVGCKAFIEEAREGSTGWSLMAYPPNVGPSAQGKVPHLIDPVRRGAALKYEQQVLEHLTGRQPLRNGEDARHWLSRAYALMSATDQSRHVVRQHDPVFLRGPSQQGFIGRPTHSEVLHAQEIHGSNTPDQTSDEVVVEVLVNEEADHSAPGGDRRLSRRARKPSAGVAASIFALTSAA